MSVETKVLNLVNYITGSAGGWPSLSRAGIVGSVDYVIESGSDDIYFFELNTNVLNMTIMATNMPFVGRG